MAFSCHTVLASFLNLAYFQTLPKNLLQISDPIQKVPCQNLCTCKTITLKCYCFCFRWRIVIHGGIDGYSRMPVYLHASNNNKASTVLTLFKNAVSEYGLPSRVRCDKGSENYDVGSFMLNHPNRGPGRGSIIAGTKNTNIKL